MSVPKKKIHGTSYSNDKYIKLRNYQAFQQAILLGLLNNHCSITLLKPPKSSTSTVQFLTVDSLIFSNEDIVEVDNIVRERCDKHIQEEINNGLSRKTALRRYDNYKFACHLHFLADVLFCFGYIFLVSQSMGKNKSIRFDTIESIFKEDKRIITNREINSIGNKINSYLCSIVRKSSSVTIEMKDKNISNLMNETKN